MRRNGTLAVMAAHISWGLLPIYWKAVQHVGPVEILCHRIVWSFGLVMVLLVARGQWDGLCQARKQPRTLVAFLVTTGLLGSNWLLYIWAVNTGHLVDTSLGYFINPLLSVLLGVVFLRERLRPWQWVAVGLAAVGVIYLTVSLGNLPWISLVLAATFGIYGLVRKSAPVNPLEGLGLEMAFMFLPALGWLVALAAMGGGVLGRASVGTHVLISLAGVVTTVPLLLFNYGAKRIKLATAGILQYFAPTGQFLLGVLAYGEPFPRERMIGFCVIWTALLIYSLEGILVSRRRVAAQVSSG